MRQGGGLELSFLGVDPGQSGGIGIINPTGRHSEVFKMGETEADTFKIFEGLKDRIAFCCIEAVHSMPAQGVSSSFKFGRNYGFLRGVIVALRIPFQEVSPQRWQKELQCMTHGDKNISKARAQQLFPSLRITHAVADAILIAEFCRRTYRV